MYSYEYMHAIENMLLLQMVPSKQSKEHIPFNDLPNAADVNNTGKLLFKGTI